MNRRSVICIVLLIGLAVIVQYGLIKLQVLSQTTYSALYFWLRPGVLGWGAVLAGALLVGIFAPQKRRLPLPVFIALVIVSVVVAFFTYVWAALPIALPAMAISLFQADFASILSGVLLGALVTNQIRRSEPKDTEQASALNEESHHG